MCGKVNFTNLSRHSDLSECTYRRQYQKDVQFTELNRALITQASRTGRALLAVMDCSKIAKSGKATFGLDAFWNGGASRVETGLEVSVVGVVDVETETGYVLSVEPTYAQSACQSLVGLSSIRIIKGCVRSELPKEVEYLTVDGAYAKEGSAKQVMMNCNSGQNTK